MSKQRGRPDPQQAPRERGASAHATLSAFGFSISADVEIGGPAADFLGGIAGNAAAAGLFEQIDPGRAAGTLVREWLTGRKKPTREELVEVARTLPDDHGILDVLNDLGGRLAGVRDAVGKKAEERKKAAKDRNANRGGKAGGNKDGDDASTGAPQGGGEDEEQVDQGGVELSGVHWRSKADSLGWVNSTDLGDLDSSWGSKAKTFIDGLEDSGARVTINAGLRHEKRAMLMHYAWKVAHGQLSPEAATTACQAGGININWDHGSLEASQAAAQSLVGAFGLVACASLTSNHIKGLALDLTIENVPDSVTIGGQTFQTDQGAGGQCDEDKVDHIGEEFGVIWYGSGDWVHWSKTGG